MPGRNQRVMRLFAIAAVAASLAACAGSNSSEVGAGQAVSGNERGGKVPYQDGAISSAMSAAQAHCGKFGKKAQVTRMNPSADGGEVAFQCD